MAEKVGSSTVTYRLKLRCRHIDWIQETENLYNKVLEFYYKILTEHLEFLELGNMELLRQLEQMTIIGRDKQPVMMPLPFQKVPLYFRRSAINAAISHARSYVGLLQNWEQKKKRQKKRDICGKGESLLQQKVSMLLLYFTRGCLRNLEKAASYSNYGMDVPGFGFGIPIMVENCRKRE